jgi:hypothetical protein
MPHLRCRSGASRPAQSASRGPPRRASWDSAEGGSPTILTVNGERVNVGCARSRDCYTALSLPTRFRAGPPRFVNPHTAHASCHIARPGRAGLSAHCTLEPRVGVGHNGSPARVAERGAHDAHAREARGGRGHECHSRAGRHASMPRAGEDTIKASHRMRSSCGTVVTVSRQPTKRSSAPHACQGACA